MYLFAHLYILPHASNLRAEKFQIKKKMLANNNNHGMRVYESAILLVSLLPAVDQWLPW